METLDFAMNFEQNEQSEADKKLFVVFYADVVKNEPKSASMGRPVFDEITLVKIITPGSRDSFVGDATLEYQQRFPKQWQRFKEGKEQNLSGTPLNQLAWLSIAQIAEFNAVGCYTVEHLAGMSDSVAHKFMGMASIKQRAQLYLDTANADAPITKLQADLQARDEQIKEMSGLIASMKNRLDALEAPKIGQKAPTQKV